MLYTEPDDPLKGKFSAKYNVAAALVDGKVAIDTFSDAKIADPKVQETMGKVRTRVLSKWEQGSSDFLRGVPVRITLKDGRVFQHTTPRDQILGSQKNPWGFDNLKDKFQVNARLALPSEQVEEAIATWSDIPGVTDIAGAIRHSLVRNAG